MSATQRRSLHVNSIRAYEQGRVDLFSKRELAILGAFRAAGPGAKATDRQVMLALGFSDMNSVRPRITELINDGVLVEVGETTDGVTRKRVRLVSLRASVIQQPELALT